MSVPPTGRLATEITRGEWAWAAGLTAAALLITSAPYVVGYLSQTPELAYSGAVINRGDYEVYLSSINAGLRGAWKYTLLHSAQPSAPAFIRTFYILVGQIGRLVPLPAAWLYQAARLVCGAWALLTMYAFAARFVRPAALRRAALAFYAFGSGFGWLTMLLHVEPTPGVSPVDFWLTDLYGFNSLMLFPHFVAVAALLMTAALAVLEHWRTGRWRWLALGAAALVLAEAFQTFAPLMADAALALYALAYWVRRRRVVWPQAASLGVLALSQAPLALLAASTLLRDPVWREYLRQNVTLSPEPIYYLLGLGLLGPLAAWGAVRLARRRWSEANLPIAWVVAVAVLVYIPSNYQRRFTEGVLGPLAVLAAVGLGWGAMPALQSLPSFRRRFGRATRLYRIGRGMILASAVLATAASTFYLVVGISRVIARRDPLLFDSAGVVRAVDWLGENTDWEATVFSAQRTGSLIAGRIGHRVALGHLMETADFLGTSEQVERFYGDMPDAERRRLLAEAGVRFVFFGPYERDLGGFDPAGAGYLARRFRSGDAAVYEVVKP